MGMNLWGASPLYVNSVYVTDLFHRHKYKAEPLGKLAQQNEAPEFRSYGKYWGCVVKVHVLIRGDLPDGRLVIPAASDVVTHIG